MMISYAQNFEDVMLWRAFKDIAGGRYVDVGAFHPEIDSVTKWFYDQGWSGINIEPVPESFALFATARPRDRNIRAAAGALAGTAEMTIFPESRGLSSLRPATETKSKDHILCQVDILPLRDILEPHQGEEIHFLKVDAEGTERDVLLGMDFQRFRPWVVLVEATEPLSSVRSCQEWQDILLTSGYQSVYFDGLNQFYVSPEHAQLATRFQAPPNVFDNFELVSTVHERQWRHEMEAVLQSQIAALNRDINALHQERAALHQERAVLRDQITSSQAVLDKLRADIGELSQRLRESQEVVETIFRSRSWRWLAPIRDFNYWVRSYRKHLRVARLFR